MRSPNPVITDAAERSVFEEKEPPAQPVEKVNILIVDDLPEKHLVYETILDELGQNLVFVSSGEEALRRVLTTDFAVILLDVNMPGMDGFETAGLIRGRRKSAHTPIIFLTAFTDEMHAAQGYASGAVDYLPTPVVPEVLKAKVKVFIELSQMRSQAAQQAEEKARRTAAEETARRSDFLFKASEALARATNPDGVLSTIARFPVPLLADAVFVWVAEDTEAGGHIEFFFPDMEKSGAARKNFSPDSLPWIDKVIRHVQSTGQQQFIEGLPQSETGLKSALALPLLMQGKPRGVVVLACKACQLSYQGSDLSLVTDFTNRASAALENAMLIARIQDADKRKDEFLATLAHELRNPLAPISNALQILRMSGTTEPRLVQVTDIMQRQVDHMNRLVDDLLDVSRITRGKLELKKENIELSPIIQSAVETSKPLIEQAGHGLTIKLPATPVYLMGDATRLSQVFSNLLNNAAKYTAPGGKIYLKVILEGSRIFVSVRDTGIGIPQHMLPRIFDMFTQVDSSMERSHGGLGIGLKLVKEVCELHNGSVTATSAGTGKGSEFIVRLPASEKTFHEIESEKEKMGKEKVYRVLIVDDNKASAETMLWTLELLGHEARLAHDGPSAIEIAREFRPDVVLLDIGLPGMNGYEVCKKMHEEEAFQKTLFVAQTGWGQAEHRQRSKEAGFNHHLVKPVSINMLQQILQELDSNLAE